MKILIKKIVCWAGVVVMLVAATLSPLVVMAEGSSVNYNDLAAKLLWVRAADMCLKNVATEYKMEDASLSDTGSTSNGATTAAERREKVAGILEFSNLQMSGNYTIYNTYLDYYAGGNNKIGDNMFWCRELNESQTNGLIHKALADFRVDWNKAACAAYDIYIGRGTLGQYGTATLDDDSYNVGEGYELPDGWNFERSGSRVTSCERDINTIKSALLKTSSAYGREPANAGDRLIVTVKRKDNFSIEKFLVDNGYLGNTSGITTELEYAVKVVSFNKACAVEQVNESDNAVSNVYRIFDGASIKSVRLSGDEADKHVFVNVTTSNSGWTTCKDLARELSPDDGGTAGFLLDDKRLKDTTNCVAIAQENRNKINEDVAKVSAAYNAATQFLIELRRALGRFDAGEVSGELNINPVLGQYNDFMSYSRDFTAFNSLKSEIQSVWDSFLGYINAEYMIGFDVDDRETVDGRIENFEQNLNLIRTNVVTPVTNLATQIPNLNQSVSGADGKIKESVEGLYYFYTDESDDGKEKIKCVADDTITDISNQVGSITGKKINLTKYQELEHDTEVYETGTLDTKVCYDGSGALGWLLCPIIEAVSGIGNNMWTQIEEYHLKIPASNIFQRDGGVQKAWGVIRDVANIVFVILFLFVIFSQLTGVGIDNYGIKKILPKLIVVAILMNLSWIICELAVDLSNIFGTGLNSMLSGFAENVASAGSASLGAQVSGWITVLALAGGGVALFTILNPAGAIMAGATIGLAVVGVVITIVVAMLTLYVILVIREAGIILMIILAPVAIVGYALPNTEKLSKKWFDIFKALLVVYPLCGMVVGAGQLAGAVLASIDAPSMKIAAMLVQVIPYFLIPMLLKNSLSLMGNIGAKVSSFGRQWGQKGARGLQNGIKNTRRFKEWSQYQSEASVARRAKRIKAAMDKEAARRGGVKNLSRWQQRRLSQANQALVGFGVQQERDEMGADNEIGYDAERSQRSAAFANEREKKYSEIFGRETERSTINDKFKESLRGNNAEMTTAAMKELIARGGIKEAMEALNDDTLDWEAMERNGISKRLEQAMGATNIDAFKSFSKYRGSGGKASFSDWYNGTINPTLAAAEAGKVKDATYANHLLEMGAHAMDNLSKDEMQFALNDPVRLKNLEAGVGSDRFNVMLGNTAMKSQDARVQTIAEGHITNRLKNGTLTAKGLGLTAESFGTMRKEMADAILEGYVERMRMANPTMPDATLRVNAKLQLQREMQNEINAVKADPRIANKVAGGVKDVFGIP